MKELLKSKTFWTGIASVIGGVALILTGDKDTGLQMVSAGLLAIFLRNGMNKK